MTIPPPRVILYLEDNRKLQELTSDVFEFAGWYVKPASDSMHAWAMLDCTREHFDLLLFDHELRKIDGLELVRRVRRMPHRKGIPIILISLKDLTEQAREAGADAFLRKPYNLIELLDTIRRLLPATAEA